MKNIILHIGVAKTGTSLIQTELAKHAEDVLRCNGYAYPDFGSAEAAAKHEVTSGNGAFLAKWMNPSLPVPGYPIDWSPNSIFDLAGNDRNIVISSEFLMGFQEDRFREFDNMCSIKGYSISVAVYFRSIGGHAMSSYAQHVKRAHYFHSFEYFTENDYKNVFFPLLKKLYRIKDIASIQTFNYDSKKCALAEHFFSEILGIKKCSFKSKRINRSLSLIELSALSRLNEMTQKHSNGKSLVANLSDSLIRKYPDLISANVMSKKAANALGKRYGGILSDINILLGPENSISLFDSDVIVESSSPETSYSEQHLVEIFCLAFEKLLPRKN